MKVGELVERLQRLPLDAEVLVSDGEFCASDTPNLRLDVGDDGSVSIGPGLTDEQREEADSACALAGHPLTHVWGGSGPNTRVCECGERRGETICAECGTPWATDEGHNRSCFLWRAMHPDDDDRSPLASLDRMCLGEEDPT